MSVDDTLRAAYAAAAVVVLLVCLAMAQDSYA